MPDPKTDPPTPTEPTQDDQEEAFWTKFEGKMDSWFDKKVEKYRGTSTTRTGRTTLPGIMANMIFGPDKENK